MRTLDEVMKKDWNKIFPRAIQIQTNSRCNASCSYCPYNTTSQIFEHGKMSDELFEKIVVELEQWQPDLVAPYLNNEPLLDKKIFDRIRELRRNLPNTFIDISTNASAMTERIAYELVSPELDIDEIKVNFASTDKTKYENTMKLSYDRTLANVKKFHEIAQKTRFDGRYRIILVGHDRPESDSEFFQNEEIPTKIYTKVSRGGIIKTAYETNEEVRGCKYNRESEWFHILHNGEVVLCCMDWYRQHILGDVNENTIKQIWNNTAYQQIRRKVNNNSDCDSICNNCEWALKNER